MQRIVGILHGQFEVASYCPVCQEYWSRYMESDDVTMWGDLRLNDPDGWEAIRRGHETATRT